MTAGRKRAFDRDIALQKAMTVFWKNGYSGTSLSDLTSAMNINKPSMYAAFGNKESLFIEALQLYARQHGMPHTQCLQQPELSMQERVANFLESVARMLTDSKNPCGCFIASSTNEAASECFPTEAKEAIKVINQQSMNYFADLLAKEKIENNGKSARSTKAMVDYLMAAQYGLAIMARNGATRQRLNDVIKQMTNGI